MVSSSVPLNGNAAEVPPLDVLKTDQAKRLLAPLGPIEITKRGSTTYVSLSQSETSKRQIGGVLSGVFYIGSTKRDAILGILGKVLTPGEFVIRNAFGVEGKRQTFAWNGKKFVALP